MKFDDTFSKKLVEIGRRMPKESAQVVREIAEESEKIIRRETPRSGRKGTSYYWTKPLADSVVKSNMYGQQKRQPKMTVGYDNTEGWRAHFPAYGTIFQRKQGFIDKSQEKIAAYGEKRFEQFLEEMTK